jgi:hypothetical protein
VTSNDATPTIPAGWYPDHEGGPRLRWWDGGQWTEHVSEPTVPAYTTVAPVPRAVPVETPAGNVYIWLIVLLPIVSVLLELTINYSAMMAASITDPLAIYRDPGYIATVLFGLFLYAATVVLAYFDWKRLKTTGFDRPFHWGFAFIGTIVYLIGRTVIVYRRSHRGLAPLWAYIGVIVLSIIVSVIEVSSIVGTVMQNVPNLPTNA